MGQVTFPLLSLCVLCKGPLPKEREREWPPEPVWGWVTPPRLLPWAPEAGSGILCLLTPMSHRVPPARCMEMGGDAQRGCVTAQELTAQGLTPTPHHHSWRLENKQRPKLRHSLWLS